jgi:hypothetical protein
MRRTWLRRGPLRRQAFSLRLAWARRIFGLRVWIRRHRLRQCGRGFRVLWISLPLLRIRRRRPRRSGLRFRVLLILRPLLRIRRRRLRRCGLRFRFLPIFRPRLLRISRHRLPTRRTLRPRWRASPMSSQFPRCRGVFLAQTAPRRRRRTCGGTSCRSRCSGAGSTPTGIPNRCPGSPDSARTATGPGIPRSALRFVRGRRRSCP